VYMSDRGRQLRVPLRILGDIQTVYSADNLRKESSVARGSTEHCSSGYGSTVHIDRTYLENKYINTRVNNLGMICVFYGEN